MAAGLPFVAWVAVSQAKKAIVHIRTFAALIRLPSPVVVKVDDRTRELVRLRCGFGGTAEEVARWLEGAFLLGAALVFFLFPRQDEEQAQLAAYAAEDAAGAAGATPA